MDHQSIEQCVETLCHKGCRQVWPVIDALEAGETVPETQGLTESEIEFVIKELKAVMAVYEGTCAVN